MKVFPGGGWDTKCDDNDFFGNMLVQKSKCQWYLGALQSRTIQKTRVNYGSGWVGGSRSLGIFFFFLNRLKIAPYQYLLKVVSYYDLSVLSSVHVSDGIQKKVWIGWVGVASYIQFYFGFFGIF